MRQSKIDIGNAADVIQRGRNVTIIPNDPQSLEFVSGDKNLRRKIRYAALDVANGDSATNPDSISVDSNLFPGWKIEEYDYASLLPSVPGTYTYVEIIDNTGDNWEEAYLVVTLTHATDVGAAADEKLFRVVDATIEGSISTTTPNNVTYAISDGSVVTATGVYVWHIATTDSDGERVMLMELRKPEDYSIMQTELYLQALWESRGESHTVNIHGVFRPEDHYNALTPSASTTGAFFNFIIEAV